MSQSLPPLVLIECVDCGMPLPISSTSQVDTGAGMVVMCGGCRYWQGGRSCHVDPCFSNLKPSMQAGGLFDDLRVRHRPQCPESPSFDKRKTRTNLDRCPLSKTEDGED